MKDLFARMFPTSYQAIIDETKKETTPVPKNAFDATFTSTSVSNLNRVVMAPQELIDELKQLPHQPCLPFTLNVMFAFVNLVHNTQGEFKDAARQLYVSVGDDYSGFERDLALLAQMYVTASASGIDPQNIWLKSATSFLALMENPQEKDSAVEMLFKSWKLMLKHMGGAVRINATPKLRVYPISVLMMEDSIAVVFTEMATSASLCNYAFSNRSFSELGDTQYDNVLAAVKKANSVEEIAYAAIAYMAESFARPIASAYTRLVPNSGNIYKGIFSNLLVQDICNIKNASKNYMGTEVTHNGTSISITAYSACWMDDDGRVVLENPTPESKAYRARDFEIGLAIDLPSCYAFGDKMTNQFFLFMSAMYAISSADLYDTIYENKSMEGFVKENLDHLIVAVEFLRDFYKRHYISYVAPQWRCLDGTEFDELIDVLKNDPQSLCHPSLVGEFSTTAQAYLGTIPYVHMAGQMATGRFKHAYAYPIGNVNTKKGTISIMLDFDHSYSEEMLEKIRNMADIRNKIIEKYQ